MKFDRNHMPINMLTRLGGATCATNDWPMGDKYNSPTVSTSVLPTSHRKLIFCVSPRPCAMKIKGTKEIPSSTHPMAILVMLPGSLPARDCQPQKEISSGVSAKMNIGLTAWNHV